MSPHAWFPTGRDDAPLGRLDLEDGRSSINQRQLRRAGLAGWQPTTTAALLTAWELTAKPGCFYDVGANAGLYTLLCGLLWPSIEAVAFEPSPATVAAGRRWARANGLEPRFEQLALSDTEGQGTLYVSERSDASNSLVAGFRRASGTVEVPLTTLDGYVARTGLAPTVVKIDVEQHEPAVIRGADTTLRERRPVVVMELLGSRASRRAHRRLRALGYESLDLGQRDHLYWPDGLPAAWPAHYDGWRRAVARCTPTRPAAGRAGRWRRAWRPRRAGRP